MLIFSQIDFKGAVAGALLLLALVAHDTYADGKTVATVNGKPIKEDALMAEVNKILPLASFHATVSEAKLRKLRDQALRKLIEEELLYQEAKKQQIQVEQMEILHSVSVMKARYASEKDFRQALAGAGLDVLSLMDLVQRRLLIRKIQQKEIWDQVQVNDSELREYFEANKAKFVIPEQRRVRHILISVSPGAMATGWQAGLNKAKQVYQRIMAGEDFAMLARELSADSSSRDKGGDLGWLHKGQLIRELEDALEKMQVGEVSQPVRTIYGFHILRYEATRPPKQLTFQEVNLERLKKKLIMKRVETRRQQFLSELMKKSKIKIFEH